MPRESIMLPILLAVAAVAAIPIAIPCAASAPPPGGHGWLPWALLALGVGGVAVAVFERRPAFDPKAGIKGNALVLLLGPIGARVGYALIGGAFLGGGIGLLAA
jgi:hypothetical protein